MANLRHIVILQEYANSTVRITSIRITHRTIRFPSYIYQSQEMVM